MAKKVLMLVENSFQDAEFIYPFYRMQEAGFEVVVASREKTQAKGKYGMTAHVDEEIGNCRAEDFEAVIIPGGYAPDKLRMYEEALEIVRNADKSGKVVAAICHAGWVIASAGIIKGRNVTSYEAIKDDMMNAGGKWNDEEVVVDGNLITSRKPSDLPEFCREILKKLS